MVDREVRAKCLHVVQAILAL